MGSDYPASKFIKLAMKSVDKINAESNWVLPIFLQCLRYSQPPCHISPPAATAHRCPKPNPLICLNNPTGKALRNTPTCFLRLLCRDGVWFVVDIVVTYISVCSDCFQLKAHSLLSSVLYHVSCSSVWSDSHFIYSDYSFSPIYS